MINDKLSIIQKLTLLITLQLCSNLAIGIFWESWWGISLVQEYHKLCLHSPITEARDLYIPSSCYEAHDGIKVIYGVCVQMTLPSRSEYF